MGERNEIILGLGCFYRETMERRKREREREIYTKARELGDRE